MRLTKLRIFSILVMLMFLTACATVEKTTYSTLSISQQTYDKTLLILGDLYKAGQLTTVQKDIIIEKANEYKVAHNTAVKAFLKYKQSEIMVDEENYLVALTKATSLLAEYLELVRPYILGGK